MTTYNIGPLNSIANTLDYITLISIFESLASKKDIIRAERSGRYKLASNTCNSILINIINRINPIDKRIGEPDIKTFNLVFAHSKPSTKKLILYVFDVLFYKIKLAGLVDDIPESHIDKLFSTSTELVNVLYDNTHTRNHVFTAMRKAICKHHGPNSHLYKESIKKLGLTYEERLKLKEDYACKVQAIGSIRADLVKIYYDDIKEIVDALIYTFNDILKPDNQKVVDAIIVIQLAIGSRLIEVLGVSQYNLIATNIIEVRGLAKTNTHAKMGNPQEPKKVVRPLMFIDSDNFFKAVSIVRSNLDLANSDLYELSKKYDILVNARCDKVFAKYQSIVFKISSHKLRYISANMAYLKYGNRSYEDNFISAYLGHNSTSTAKSYMGINCLLGNSKTQISDIAESGPKPKIPIKDESQDVETPDIAEPEPVPQKYEFFEPSLVISALGLDICKSRNAVKRSKHELDNIKAIKFQAMRRLAELCRKQGIEPSYRMYNRHGYSNNTIIKYRNFNGGSL
jgi:hypothetical protein